MDAITAGRDLVDCSGGTLTVAAFRIKKAELSAISRLRDAYPAQARATQRTGMPGQRYDSLAALAKAAAMQPSPEMRDELRNEAVACMALTDLRVAQESETNLASPSDSLSVDRPLESYARPPFNDNTATTVQSRVDERFEWYARLSGVNDITVTPVVRSK